MGRLHELFARQTGAEKVDALVLLDVDWAGAEDAGDWRSMVSPEIRLMWPRLGTNARMVARLVAQFAAARASEQAAERAVAGGRQLFP